jgi:hypothetical protein
MRDFFQKQNPDTPTVTVVSDRDPPIGDFFQKKKRSDGKRLQQLRGTGKAKGVSFRRGMSVLGGTPAAPRPGS